MTLAAHCRRAHDAVTTHTATLTTLERRAWAMGLLLFVGADVALTAVGLRLGAVEANPAAHGLMSAVGVWPAVAVGKLVSVALFALAWAMWSRWLDAVGDRACIPIMLSWLGGIIVINNAYVVAVRAGFI